MEDNSAVRSTDSYYNVEDLQNIMLSKRRHIKGHYESDFIGNILARQIFRKKSIRVLASSLVAWVRKAKSKKCEISFSGRETF